MKISQESRAGAWRAPCPSFTFRKARFRAKSALQLIWDVNEFADRVNFSV